IEPRRVILRRNGITESLTLEVELLQRVDGNDDRAADNPGRQRFVERATFEREIEDLPRLVRQAQAVPYSENGSPVGLRVVRIEQGSVFHDLGLEPEDVIRSVNGTPVRNVAEARAAYETFKNAGAYAIGVLRDGRELTLNYSIR
ncbi:MAG: PDZ domain-containing protein, partial [Planctomycetes bacterium]|nr:PDZ domain-containing protein [Planctomycetota bacterium]